MKSRDLTSLTLESEAHIMTVEEVAQYLRKSRSWVYRHWRLLGGVKLGGSLFFPGKPDQEDPNRHGLLGPG